MPIFCLQNLSLVPLQQILIQIIFLLLSSHQSFLVFHLYGQRVVESSHRLASWFYGGKCHDMTVLLSVLIACCSTLSRNETIVWPIESCSRKGLGFVRILSESPTKENKSSSPEETESLFPLPTGLPGHSSMTWLKG